MPRKNAGIKRKSGEDNVNELQSPVKKVTLNNEFRMILTLIKGVGRQANNILVANRNGEVSIQDIRTLNNNLVEVLGKIMNWSMKNGQISQLYQQSSWVELYNGLIGLALLNMQIQHTSYLTRLLFATFNIPTKAILSITALMYGSPNDLSMFRTITPIYASMCNFLMRNTVQLSITNRRILEDALVINNNLSMNNSATTPSIK